MGCREADIDVCTMQGELLIDLPNVTLANCTLRGTLHITGENSVVRDLIIDATGYSHGILIEASNVLIENVVVFGAGKAGIESRGYKGEHDNVRVIGCIARGNLGDPSITDNWSGSGIVLGGVRNSLIEDCVAFGNGELTNSEARNGPVGIWMYFAENSIIRGCRSFDNRTREGHNDGGGFAFDGGSTGCQLIDCEAYGNDGPGMLFWSWAPGKYPNGDNLAIRLKSYDNRRGGIYVGGNLSGNEIRDSDIQDGGFSKSPTVVRRTKFCGRVRGDFIIKNPTTCD